MLKIFFGLQMLVVVGMSFTYMLVDVAVKPTLAEGTLTATAGLLFVGVQFIVSEIKKVK